MGDAELATPEGSGAHDQSFKSGGNHQELCAGAKGFAVTGDLDGKRAVETGDIMGIGTGEHSAAHGIGEAQRKLPSFLSTPLALKAR